MICKFRLIIKMAISTLLLVMLAGCAKKEEPRLISIDGSSTVYPITEAVSEEFLKLNKNVKVTVGVSGTGGGFKKFSRGEIDISNASRPIKASEMELCQKNGIEYIELPVAFDGISVVINPQNFWVNYLTVSELKKIWAPEAEGKITRWNQIRLNWPNEEIHLYGAGVASGTFDYFTEAIVGKSGASRGDYTSSEDDNVLVQGVATDRLALGYFGVAYYEGNTDRLTAVPIDDENDANGKGAFLPTIDNVAKGLYQPLVRPVFIYVNRKSLDRKEVQDFVEFYLRNAPELVKEVGYISLPQGDYDFALERFKKRITGSVFFDAKPGMRIDELLKKE